MSKWSKYRWRPGMPDDPALWVIHAKGSTPEQKLAKERAQYAFAYGMPETKGRRLPLIRWT